MPGTTKKNKVKFNIKNAHVAVKTTSEEGDITYGTPFAVPGSVSLSLEAQGEITPFYADGVKYYVSSSNNGYEGDWENALIPDEFRQQILKETLDTNKALMETQNTETQEFAFGFEIDGDVKGTKFWFYNCTATRPTVESSTTEDTIEPTTDTLTISATGADVKGDGKMYVRAKTTPEMDESTYNGWFNKVYIPDQAGTMSVMKSEPDTQSEGVVENEDDTESEEIV